MYIYNIYVYIHIYIYNYCRINKLNPHHHIIAANSFMLSKQSSGNK